MSGDTPTPIIPLPSAAQNQPQAQVPEAEYSLKGGALHRWGHPLSCPFQPAFIGPPRIQGQGHKINRLPCSKDCALFHFELLPATKLGVPESDPAANQVVPVVQLNCGTGRTIVVEVPSDKDGAEGSPN